MSVRLSTTKTIKQLEINHLNLTPSSLSPLPLKKAAIYFIYTIYVKTSVAFETKQIIIDYPIIYKYKIDKFYALPLVFI